ncbi:hypothetical protein EDC56_0972 [Sinobacterium caligoides]|uniref:Uncharacterized protein n=1 Tax=Sinobacterium caligoides TaxID=933926 RepID=A0A3N2E0K9_9GAMM|nr:hypothetical protein EDC56_0972 [Sinobacterium caligoides]
MISLLFTLFFIAQVLTLKGKEKAALYTSFFALVISLFWLIHHSTDQLSILL